MQGELLDDQTAAMPADALAPGETTMPLTAVVGPVVGKRKKRRYSKGLKEIQQFERSLSKASTRVARAVAKGMETYRKRSATSALKKRDGALRDFSVNFADGLGKTMRVLSGVPSDLAKAVNTPRARKRMRRQLRAASRVLRPLR